MLISRKKMDFLFEKRSVLWIGGNEKQAADLSKQFISLTIHDNTWYVDELVWG